MEDSLPERVRQLYSRHLAVVRSFAEEATGAGIPADVVAQAPAHALTAYRPKTRYVVGADARIRAALAPVLPDRVRDALIVRRVGLP